MKRFCIRNAILSLHTHILYIAYHHLTQFSVVNVILVQARMRIMITQKPSKYERIAGTQYFVNAYIFSSIIIFVRGAAA